MRNGEIGLFALGLVGLSAVGVTAGFFLSAAAGLLCLALALALGAWALVFTAWRYRQIRKLSVALAAASATGQVLDVRTNREGELSILKNDIYKLTAALAGQADHLRADKLFLTQALGDISHQLKTPLTSMTVYCDLLQNNALPAEKRREFLQGISAQLQRLSWLVSSLLKLSRIDARVVPFKRRPVALHSLLSAALQPLLPLAEQKDVAMTVDCPRALGWTGDAEWTAQAIGNLMKNGLEHAPPGGNVTVRCVENPLNLLLLVEDDGPGFAPEELPRLFERFYRGKSASGEGVGIGLAMAKSILQAQKADVTAENRPEGGARFVVKLYK